MFRTTNPHEKLTTEFLDNLLKDYDGRIRPDFGSKWSVYDPINSSLKFYADQKRNSSPDMNSIIYESSCYKILLAWF